MSSSNSVSEEEGTNTRLSAPIISAPIISAAVGSSQQSRDDEELSKAELMNIIKRLQQQEQTNERLINELLSERKERIENENGELPRGREVNNPRRATIYRRNDTPQRVNERTSMGGMSLYSEYDHTDDEDVVNDFNGDKMGERRITTMKVKEPPLFEGDANSDVNRWLELIEDFMSCYSESEVMKVQKVMLYLGEGPRIHYD